jgi:hypothetical protein
MIQTSNDPAAEYFVPTAEWIASLQVGDLAPDHFGRLAEITRIYARDVDTNGTPFICLYVRLSEDSQISADFKAGELVRTVQLCGRHTSHELRQIEKGAER